LEHRALHSFLHDALPILPQPVKRLSSLRLSNTLVAKASMFHLEKSRPANRSTSVAACSLPWKLDAFGLQMAVPRRSVQSVPTPASDTRVLSDDGAEPW